ncbi:MAG: minichromosome maintenance protein MCM [Nanoarchaeota archaeon]|nr:minichromosome maintenance protein MCM [Nanoarchaeota archaeon]
MELLDNKTLIERFHKFFEEYKRKEIKKAINEESACLLVSFFEISEYDIELGDQLLAHPEDIIKIMEESLRDFYEEDTKIKLKVRLTSLPATEKLMIRDIRSEHIGKLIILEGLVRRKTDVRPRLRYMEYLCTNPSCTYSEDKLKIPQLDDKAKILKACPKCKSGIELLKKDLVDSQSLILEEIPEQLDNSADQPKRVTILLQEDLVSPFKDSKTNPGSRVYVIGIVREIPLQTRTGAESTNYEILIDGNYIDLTEDDYSEIEISKEEIQEIKELAKKPDVVEILVKNTAPSIHGYTKIKESILLQLFGGSGGIKGDGIKTRGDIHILLIGDPGAAKSQLLKAATKVAPKSSFVSGKSATGAGLTATVIKDELTKGWALEAGAIVLASGGLCAIDELDKMSEEDTSAMHEALEQQTISIAKANIRATLKCQTTVLGAANPKFGRFDPYGDIGKQINFPPALISRFDLIFILRDIPDKKKDDLIANHILQSHRDKTKTITDIKPEFLKKYIAYTKTIKPVLTQEAITKIKDFYVKIRNASSDEESGVKSVPITARQLEAIVRLAEAYAKIKLDKIVKEEYAEKAIAMLMYCLEKIGIDPKTGEMDIDRITTGVTASSRNQYKIIQNIIDKLETEKPEIVIDDIIEEAEKQKISSKEVNKILEKLKQEGIIFEPRKNIFKKLI